MIRRLRRLPRLTIGVRLAGVTALLVVIVATVMLAVSYVLLVGWLPDTIVLRGPAGEVAVPVASPTPNSSEVHWLPELANGGPVIAVLPDGTCLWALPTGNTSSTIAAAARPVGERGAQPAPAGADPCPEQTGTTPDAGAGNAPPAPVGGRALETGDGGLARALGATDGALSVLGSATERTVKDPTTTAITASPEEIRQQVDLLLTQLVQDAARGYRTKVLKRFAAQSAVMLTLLTIAAVAVGWAGSRRLLRPVHAMSATAKRLGGGSLGERIEVSGPRDELRELAETFNAMLDRVEEAFGRERRFMANVSHELRTPLANQHVALELALEDPDASADDLRRVAGTALDQNVRARHLIEELLILARAEQGTADPATGHCDLADAARHAIEGVRAVPDAAAGLDLREDLSPAQVRGHPALIERLVGNLVENGVRHNHPGGFVRITTTALDGAGRIQIENSGPIVPADAVDGLFEPFRRGSPGHGDRIRSDRGAGLGLSVVAAVARRHGAQLQATARPEGGLRVVVTFPAAVPDARGPEVTDADPAPRPG